MVKSTVNFYPVSKDKIVDESVLKTIVGGTINLDSIKKEAVNLYRKKNSKVISGTLIRIDKEDDKTGCTLNEYYIYYDGISFKRKFDLYWDMKEMSELLGGPRFEPVQNLREL